MFKRSMLMFAILGLGGPAAAQAVDPAAAKARAQDMISQAWADSAFTAGAWAQGPMARHHKTGLVCRFNGDRRNTVDVYEKKFNNVGCSVGHGDTTLYSYANPPVGGIDQIIIGAEQALGRAFTNVEPYTGPAADAPAAGTPPTAVRRFTGERDGKRWHIRLTAMDMGRWSYIQRAVGPLGSEAQIDRLAAASMADQVRDAGFSVQTAAR